MRTLIYVPIIHTSADLGSLAKDVAKRGIAGFGEEFWERHKEMVAGFWDSISHYFNSVDAFGIKIYQDGMVAEGEVGERIVEEGIKSGSKNYEIVSRLLKRGAILVKTEDFNLVKEEHDRLVGITKAKATTQKMLAFIRYKLVKGRLLDKRDNFIARRIDETLNDGETGILFIGAYHNIIPQLPEGIEVIKIKDPEKVRAYQRELLSLRRDKERFDELSEYLISPVK